MNVEHYVAAIHARATGALDVWTIAYVTDGGTYVLAASGRGTDSGRPHDLIAILPVPIDGTRVVVLRVTANPEWVGALRAALDGDGVR